ncbi:MAG: hypothetical protein MK291_01115 [Planctomycetes bacterium]|nr:hypothetical protein [Planctomycetota bacterium]
MTAPAVAKSCPTCGAPITREDLSLCSYCGSPLQLGGAQENAEAERSLNQERLGKMPEKEEWSAAMDWEPLMASRYPGGSAVAIPLLSGSIAAIITAWVFNYVAGLVIGSVTLITLFARHLRQDPVSPLNPDAPLLKRAAVVLDRRSETEIVGGDGRTTYYFILEFADGARGEFRFPGRGATFDLMVNGVTGVAYTRGADLLAFKKIRV